MSFFFLKSGGKSVGEAAPPLYFSKRDIEAIKDVSIGKTGVVLFPNLDTDNE